MRIRNTGRRRCRSLEDLEDGECFQMGDGVWIKTNKTKEDSIGCVLLLTGTFEYVPSCRTVYNIDAEVQTYRESKR